MQAQSIKTLFFLACLLITTTNFTALSQSTNTADSSIAGQVIADTVPIISADSISSPTSSTKSDNSFLDEKVEYSATDSIVLDVINQKAYLYNNAVVIYEDMTLRAGYIELDFGNNLIYSRGIEDSTGKVTQKPVSEQGGEKFNAGEITYNYETKKGKIKNVITQQGEGYIHGRDIKRDSNNVYYVKHGKYTTCDAEEPHFYIEAKKIKVIPDDKIVTGPAQLYIADIPTPLVLPFGFFPNKKGRASGILLPTYGESANWGFFLKDGGFYFGMSEHVDLALRGDIYANGGFALRTSSIYKKRYRYNGGLNLGYSQIIDGNKAFPTSTTQNDFFIKWNHTQDSKAKPGRRFSANVNAGSSSYNKFNGATNGDYLANTFQSNISYAKSFTGTPFNFSANMRHSQNTITKKMDITLPELALTMNRIYPFKSSKRIGNKWYDKVGISAAANSRNQISTHVAQAIRPPKSDTSYYNNYAVNEDSTLFSNRTLEKMRNGLVLTMPISTSLNVLKYFTLSPSISTSSKIYYETIRKHYDENLKQVVKDTVPGIKIGNDFSLATNLSTRIFGNYLFNSSYLKQIRHVITPTIGASYRPDFSESQYGYYKTVQSDSLGNTQQYSIFENGIYGSPASGKSGIISFGLNNSLEAKVNQQSDTGSTVKKVLLIDNLNATTSYNMAIKSFNWSNINLTARTKLFKVLNVNAGAIIDPYQVDVTDQRIELLEWQNNRIGRLTSARAALGANLNSKKKKDKPNVSSIGTEGQLDYINSHPNEYVDFDIPWSLNVSYNLQYTKAYAGESVGIKKTVTQTASFNGDLKLTKKWKIGIRSGYDFTNKKLSFTSIDIYRDLHCWEMSFNWVPFGFRQSFSLNINVKSAVLKDLKLTRRRSWQDFQ